MSSKSDDFPVKIGLSVWFCICVLIAIWVFTKFSNGRQQMYSNLHVVEESLRKMQEKIEMEQRKKSMGYVENLEDITACLERSECMKLDNMVILIIFSSNKLVVYITRHKIFFISQYY